MRTARWENTFTAGTHELIAGAEYQNDSIADSDTGFGTYAEEERDNRAVFAQGLLDFSPLTLQASLRLDDNEAYGDELTGSLAAGYALDGIHMLRASFGTAFKGMRNTGQRRSVVVAFVFTTPPNGLAVGIEMTTGKAVARASFASRNTCA